jgi:hypothetical protein
MEQPNNDLWNRTHALAKEVEAKEEKKRLGQLADSLVEDYKKSVDLKVKEEKPEELEKAA